VEVGDQIVELLNGNRIALFRHHSAATNDGFTDESVIRGQSARQILLPEQSLQARALAAPGRIRVVADGAIASENFPPACLLRVQAQFGVAFRGRLAAPSSKNEDKNENEEKKTRGNWDE